MKAFELIHEAKNPCGSSKNIMADIEILDIELESPMEYVLRLHPGCSVETEEEGGGFARFRVEVGSLTHIYSFSAL
ncbi:MAG: hypothetical protein LBC69_00830 [Eubacteriaceae bacterium]|jgi:hypothetical protein|nr:hypothetical protein [Eubacteriaceae bacterium]